ncbi:uncharacterized protein LOC130974927 [Arachis stenosperma]|uniref:uncharacterized protein LOC130974927 n=1 Tax=Arachis stenosperma TaxID=217475 RepID=UPI0025ACB5F1|nr:uncharacterized protein LOC130974927 [Arachis stenosperma]
MSSSEPTSNEQPNEPTPEVGVENVESVVRFSTDSGVLTKPPPHLKSKKRKVDSTNVGATPGATPTNPAPSNVETDEEDGKDDPNEGYPCNIRAVAGDLGDQRTIVDDLNEDENTASESEQENQDTGNNDRAIVTLQGVANQHKKGPSGGERSNGDPL